MSNTTDSFILAKKGNGLEASVMGDTMPLTVKYERCSRVDKVLSWKLDSKGTES
jgi:hypothetical protein